jgi:hypothetical protein
MIMTTTLGRSSRVVYFEITIDNYIAYKGEIAHEDDLFRIPASLAGTITLCRQYWHVMSDAYGDV